VTDGMWQDKKFKTTSAQSDMHCTSLGK